MHVLFIAEQKASPRHWKKSLLINPQLAPTATSCICLQVEAPLDPGRQI
jgi:hypothetical protein